MINPHRVLPHVLSVFLLFISGCSPAFIYHHHPEFAETYFLNKSLKAEKAAEQNPADIGGLVKACSLMTIYRYGFTMEAADRLIEEDDPSGKMKYREAHMDFIKAFQFGEKALEKKHSWFSDWFSGDIDTVPYFDLQDVPILYWTGAALGGAISSSRGNPKWVIQLPGVGKLFESALALNPNWNAGALYSAMISFSMSRSDLGDSAAEVAGEFLSSANKASGGFHAGAQLTFAETVLVKSQNKDAFLIRVNAVLNKERQNEITDVIVRKRAEWLLTRTEDLFY